MGAPAATPDETGDTTELLVVTVRTRPFRTDGLRHNSSGL